MSKRKDKKFLLLEDEMAYEFTRRDANTTMAEAIVIERGKAEPDESKDIDIEVDPDIENIPIPESTGGD